MQDARAFAPTAAVFVCRKIRVVGRTIVFKPITIGLVLVDSVCVVRTIQGTVAVVGLSVFAKRGRRPQAFQIVAHQVNRTIVTARSYIYFAVANNVYGAVFGQGCLAVGRNVGAHGKPQVIIDFWRNVRSLLRFFKR